MPRVDFFAAPNDQLGLRLGTLVLAVVVAAGITVNAACKRGRPAETLAACIPLSSLVSSLTATASTPSAGRMVSESIMMAVRPDGELIKSTDLEPALVDAISECVRQQGATYQAGCDTNGYDFTASREGVCSLVSRTAGDAKRQRVRVLLIPPTAPTAKGAEELRMGSRLVLFERRGTSWVILSDDQAFKR